MFLAGGSRAYRGDLLNVVAALDLAGTPTWITLSVSGTAPPGRYDPCVGYDPVRDRLIVFGGGYTTGPSGNTSTREDTWALSLADLTWTPIAAEPVVTFRRANAPMVYDAARDAMVIFGGGDAEAYSESPVFDAWTLPLGAASPIWTSLGPPAPVDWDGLPGPFTGMVDLAHDRLLALSLGDHATYAMPLAGPAVWSRLAIAGEAPPPRNQESLVFDPDAHRVLLYGGQDGVSRGDLWSLSFDSVTAVELSLVNADATPDQVALAWRTNLGAASFAVERRRGGTLDWERLGEASPDGDGLVRFVDRDVTPGGQYDYRLSYTDGGAEVTGGGVSVTVPRAPTFALAITGPNPSTRDLPVVLSLPDARPATLEVLDVSGRRLLARDVGALGAGRHALNLGEARCFSPGLYLVRLRRGADVRVARVAIVE